MNHTTLLQDSARLFGGSLVFAVVATTTVPKDPVWRPPGLRGNCTGYEPADDLATPTTQPDNTADADSAGQAGSASDRQAIDHIALVSQLL